MIWRARQFSYQFPRPVLLMGVVNVTPDSFSDGGKFQEAEAAIAHGLNLVAQGADLLDIGGESTRPGAQPVPAQEELRRVLPVVEGLRGRVEVPLSVDTTKLEVARACLEAGASILNDVGANRNEPALWELAAQTGAGYVLMHAQGNSQTMQLNPHYGDVVGEIGCFLKERLEGITAAGVSPEQVVLDVGLGFGKSLTHNLQLLAGIRAFKVYRRPLLLGASRKSFIGKVTGETDPAHRLPGSLACACWATREGVEIIRTHDVAATRQAVKMIEALVDHSQHVLGDDSQRS